MPEKLNFLSLKSVTTRSKGLRKFHQGNRVEVQANAVPAGDRYKCAYKAYCIVKDGPRKGEEYPCAVFERLFTLADLRGLIPVMKKELNKN